MIQTIAQAALLLLLSGVFVMGIRNHGKRYQRPFNGYVAAIGAVLEGLLIFLAGGFGS